VLEELCDLGLERAIRVGTCVALDGELALGDLVIATTALAADGTSRALGAPERVAADGGLVAALAAAAGGGRASAPSRRTDLFYDRDPARARAWVASGALAVELEAATLLRIGELRGVAIACLLAVVEVRGGKGNRRRMDADALVGAGERLGAVAAAALTASCSTSA